MSAGIYSPSMTKRLVDIDEQALADARRALGTTTMKDTVNEALRRAGGTRRRAIEDALDVLASLPPLDRDEAWR